MPRMMKDCTLAELTALADDRLVESLTTGRRRQHDDYGNHLARHIIWAMHRERGQAVLGNINLSERTRDMPICWAWEPMETVPAFSAEFVVPSEDDTLVSLIARRAEHPEEDENCELLIAITERIAMLGGVMLKWG